MCVSSKTTVHACRGGLTTLLITVLAACALSAIAACGGPTRAPAVCECGAVVDDTSASPGSQTAHPDSDGYYLGVCALCGARLGSKGESHEIVHEGRQLRFCSFSCVGLFNANPNAALARVDRVMIEDQRPHYPIDHSIVSGEPLGAQPFDCIWGNRLFRVRNEAERDSVFREPTRYISLLDAEVIRVQTPTYGMPSKCPVQGDILSSDRPIDIVVANRMVRVCCGMCVRAVRARPVQYLAMVDYANREAAADRDERPSDSP